MHFLSAIAVALIITLLSALQCASAGEQAERAVAAVRALVAAGKAGPASVINLVAKQGNIASFLGQDHELKLEWEQATGIRISSRIMPQVASLELIRSATDIDLTVARNREYADLYTEGLIRDLTPLYQRFGFVPPNHGGTDFPLAALQSTYAGRQVAIPADCDIALLYLRTDLMADPANRQAFSQQYGRHLAPPETWSEYADLVRFFNRPAQEFYGSLEQREPLTAWMFWLPRYLSQSSPNQLLFDDAMRPLINSPQGVAATQNYLANVALSPPDILKEGNDYSYTLPLFMLGRGFATIITIAGAKLFNSDNSRVRGKVQAYPLPGTRVDGRLVRRSTLIYGNNMVIPKHAPSPELAFLFAMWLTDPDNSVRSVGVRGGFTDPYRFSQLQAPRIRNIYTEQAL
ncbi:ABC transporter substrate-binding protein, partial [Sedimenticola sp.]|uniref:ABC transporter substrate-binding protein n=1 Tax=Sedimenticola sp. TaxID=1940285 RepID=UPI003D0E0B33